MNNSASASRRTWNRVMNALVRASAVLVIVLVAGILGMVLVRGIPHVNWKFLTTTASVLKSPSSFCPSARRTVHMTAPPIPIPVPADCISVTTGYTTLIAESPTSPTLFPTKKPSTIA